MSVCVCTVTHFASGSIFIGMVAVRHPPKPDVVDMLDDLNDAGIRFVWFSDEDDRRTHAFAGRMNLDTVRFGFARWT